MNSLDKQYQELLQSILLYSIEKKDRTGTGTKSIFGYTIRHNMKEGFPLLTTKKMHWKSIVTELLWFLRGDTNIKFLVDNGCHIWDGDAYKNYDNIQSTHHAINQARNMTNMDGAKPLELTKPISKEEFINKIKNDDEFAKKWGELGPIYGKQWRSWKKNDSFIVEDDVWKNNEGWCSLKDFNKDELYIDQIANLIRDLKTNPDSRRLMVNAWNVGELDSMVLPPCHYGFQVYTRELSVKERLDWYNEKNYYKVHSDFYDETTHEKIDKMSGQVPKRAISLMFNMRSNDVPLGLPFNIASYGLLLEIFGKILNMFPDELIASLGDAHIYNNQVDGIKEQLTREPYTLPKLVIPNNVNFSGTIDEFLNSCSISDFKIEGYQSHPPIKMPLSN